MIIIGGGMAAGAASCSPALLPPCGSGIRDGPASGDSRTGAGPPLRRQPRRRRLPGRDREPRKHGRLISELRNPCNWQQAGATPEEAAFGTVVQDRLLAPLHDHLAGAGSQPS